jgi:hypothetical protein
MVFKCKTSKAVEFEETDESNLRLQKPSKEDLAKMELWKGRREALLKSLASCGLNLYCFYSRDRDEVIVKIGASAAKLKDTAARCKYKLQLKPQYLGAYAEYRHDKQGTAKNNHQDQRVISHMFQRHTEDDLPDSDAIFRTSDKINLIHHIITSNDKECCGVPVGQLLRSDDLRAYFPLHDMPVLQELQDRVWDWFLMTEEHANMIRDYFGDRVAFYFLFQGYYWKWLVPISIMGILISPMNGLMQTPNNILAIPFCILLSVWSIFLPAFWKRQEAKYAVSWGTLNLTEHLEQPRMEYYGDPSVNPVSGQVEQFYPLRKRIVKYCISATVLTLTFALVMFVILGLLYARHVHTYQNFEWLLAVYVEVSNKLLSKLAQYLTAQENHRTQKEHEGHKLAKVLALKFVNSYFVLYYMAFFKQHEALFGVKMHCIHQDCWLDIQGQLAVFVFFRFTVMNMIEYSWPKLKSAANACWYNRASCLSIINEQPHVHLAELSAAEQQRKKDQYSSFDDNDEMLISHGFATLFAATSPWVCLATLVSTLVEIQIDKVKLLRDSQRPLPIKARANEPWTSAFEVFGFIAASTNVMLLIFASEQYTNFTLTEKLTLFVYLEHLLFLARVLMKLIFPEVPRNVTLLQLKQDTMVHRCLENIKVEPTQDFATLRGDRGSAEPIEVMDQDHLEEDDPEPTLRLRESGRTLREGLREALSISRSRDRDRGQFEDDVAPDPEDPEEEEEEEEDDEEDSKPMDAEKGKGKGKADDGKASAAAKDDDDSSDEEEEKPKEEDKGKGKGKQKDDDTDSSSS